MNVRLYIGGVEYTDVADGLQSLRVTYKRDDYGLLNFSVSSPIRLTERGYRLIYDNFFSDPCTGKKTVLSCEIHSYCCDEVLVYPFKLNHKSVTISRLDCRAELVLNIDNDLQNCYDYLKNTIYYENGFSQNQINPKIRYVRSRANYYLLLGILWFFSSIFYILEATETVLNLLLSILKSIANFLNIDVPFIENLEVNIPSFDNYFAYLTGAGNYHIAVYFSQIFNYHIGEANAQFGCGMSLNSELLENAPYSELVLFQADGDGISCQSINNVNFTTRTAYNRTVTQLAREVADVFNMKFYVLPDGSFTIDSIENITNQAPIVTIAENDYIEGYAEEAPSFEFDFTGFYRQTLLQYTKDSIDTEGNRQLNPNYQHVQDWVDDFEDIERNEKIFPFAPARFMFDELTAENTGFWDADLIKDRNRRGIIGFINLSAIIGLIDGVACLPRFNDLIMSDDLTSHPKLLVLQTGTDLSDAQTVRTEISQNGNNTFYSYNRPMHADSLMLFYETDNPDHPDARYLEMQPFTTSLNVEMINEIKDNGTFVAVQTEYGIAMPEEVEVNFENCTVTFKGCKYKCSA